MTAGNMAYPDSGDSRFVGFRVVCDGAYRVNRGQPYYALPDGVRENESIAVDMNGYRFLGFRLAREVK